MTDTPPPCWRAIGASVRGAAHERTGQPNQDALRIAAVDGGGLPLIVALADGHGSARSFRSDQGARLAVDAAQTVCGTLFTLDTPSRQKRWAEEHLPRELVRHWWAAVDQTLAEQPFTPAEREAFERAGHDPTAHPYLAYGATLLAVIVAPTFLLYLQLGDGDILTVSASGEVERPLLKDERLIANETTSLCSHQAWNEVRVGFQTLAGAPPALILVATDGYANSYRDEAGFRQVARDLWAMMRDEGLETVQRNLAGWLDEVSQQGSGDDITVGIVVNGSVEPLSCAHRDSCSEAGRMESPWKPTTSNSF